MNNSIKRGFFRVIVNSGWIFTMNPYAVRDSICQILEPYDLTVWGDDLFPYMLGMPYEPRGCCYYDIHVVENELYGDQPVKDLMDKILEVRGVEGIAFIDTSSVYCVPIFYTNTQTPPEIFRMIKSTFIEETLRSYKREKEKNV